MLLKSEGEGICRIDIRLTKKCANNAFLNKLYAELCLTRLWQYITKDISSGLCTQHGLQKSLEQFIDIRHNFG